jgi:hypothetical protein
VPETLSRVRVSLGTGERTSIGPASSMDNHLSRFAAEPIKLLHWVVIQHLTSLQVVIAVRAAKGEGR